MRVACVLPESGRGTRVHCQRIENDHKTPSYVQVHRRASNMKAQCQVHPGKLNRSLTLPDMFPHVTHMPPTGSLASHMTNALSPCRTTSSNSLTQCLAVGAGGRKAGASHPGAGKRLWHGTALLGNGQRVCSTTRCRRTHLQDAASLKDTRLTRNSVLASVWRAAASGPGSSPTAVFTAALLCSSRHADGGGAGRPSSESSEEPRWRRRCRWAHRAARALGSVEGGGKRKSGYRYDWDGQQRTSQQEGASLTAVKKGTQVHCPACRRTTCLTFGRPHLQPGSSMHLAPAAAAACDTAPHPSPQPAPCCASTSVPDSAPVPAAAAAAADADIPGAPLGGGRGCVTTLDTAKCGRCSASRNTCNENDIMHVYAKGHVLRVSRRPGDVTPWHPRSAGAFRTAVALLCHS